MGGLIVEEAPCVRALHIYKLLDEAETITLKGALGFGFGFGGFSSIFRSVPVFILVSDFSFIFGFGFVIRKWIFCPF
jgi:hypothetical protein